jgi:hypothetical protein
MVAALYIVVGMLVGLGIFMGSRQAAMQRRKRR